MNNEIQKAAALTQMMFSQGISDLSKTKWNKLLFFVDLAHYTKPESRAPRRTLTGFDYIKVPYGPVIQDFNKVLFQLKNENVVAIESFVGYSANNLSYLRRPEGRQVQVQDLDAEASHIAERVIRLFGKYTALKLSELSHMLTLWKGADMYQMIDFDKAFADTFIQSSSKYKSFYELAMS